MKGVSEIVSFWKSFNASFSILKRRENSLMGSKTNRNRERYEKTIKKKAAGKKKKTKLN